MSLLSIFLISLVQLLNSNQEVELVFVGDAMQHIAQIENAKQSDGNYDYSTCLINVEKDIATPDLAVVNLECPLGGKPYAGFPCFCAPDEWAKQLKRTGFDLYLTANNHCLDRRDAGLKRTISILDDIGVSHIGTYRNSTEREQLSPLIIEIKGIKFAFLNYTYGTNGITIQDDAIVNIIDRDRISKDIDKSRKAGAQALCVCLHWGDEYQLLPNKSQRALADFLVEKGVDLIIGGHPHVIQPMEIRHNDKLNKDILIVYSLGNFISNMKTTDTRGGAMVKVTLSKNDNNGATVKSAHYKLFYTVPAVGQYKSYTLIPASRPELVPASHKAYFNAFMRNARRIFSQHNINVAEIE
ncbi:MAG: CapA family protein [Muribaculaceae bacterium]